MRTIWTGFLSGATLREVREGAWEGAKQREDGELKLSSKRRRIDRRRTRKFQTPAAEALHVLFDWSPVGGGGGG